jgi:phenylpropionate dioxygenase-like ring-hydroxylating dioxygenase large terminal subunit
MASATEATPREVPFKVMHPELIPKERYYDETFFRLEQEHFWPRVWQMACRLEEIPEVGDWVEYRILDQSVIVVRSSEGVKAFHNACRHRGMELVQGHGNCANTGFVCPFHGWRYNQNGENTFAWGRHLFSEETLEAVGIDLKPVRIDFWANCAFVNFDDNAAPLYDYMKPMADRLAPHNVDKLHVEWWTSSIVPCNWKLAMEAFMEGLHTMKTHPQIQEAFLPGSDRYAPPRAADAPPGRLNMTSEEVVDRFITLHEVMSDGMGGMVHANDIAVAKDLQKTINLPDNPGEALAKFQVELNKEITKRARDKGIPMPDLQEISAIKEPLRRYCFPNTFWLIRFGNMAAYRVRPLGPESTLFEIWSLMLYPEGEKRERPIAPTSIPADDPSYPQIPPQDYSNLPKQQLGLHSRSFKHMLLSREVEGLISNYQRLIDGYLAGESEEKLCKASQITSAGLDWPIEDIGFGPVPKEVVRGEAFSTVQKIRA